jgi:hypothetical protein
VVGRHRRTISAASACAPSRGCIRGAAARRDHPRWCNFPCSLGVSIWLNHAIPEVIHPVRTYVRELPSGRARTVRTHVLFTSDIEAHAARPGCARADPRVPPARGRRSSRLGGRRGGARGNASRARMGSRAPRGAAWMANTAAGRPAGGPAAGVPLCQGPQQKYSPRLVYPEASFRRGAEPATDPRGPQGARNDLRQLAREGPGVRPAPNQNRPERPQTAASTLQRDSSTTTGNSRLAIDL